MTCLDVIVVQRPQCLSYIHPQKKFSAASVSWKFFEKVIDLLSFLPTAIAASSGLAAQSTVMQILKSGDHIVSTGDLYGGRI